MPAGHRVSADSVQSLQTLQHIPIFADISVWHFRICRGSTWEDASDQEATKVGHHLVTKPLYMGQRCHKSVLMPNQLIAAPKLLCTRMLYGCSVQPWTPRRTCQLRRYDGQHLGRSTAFDSGLGVQKGTCPTSLTNSLILFTGDPLYLRELCFLDPLQIQKLDNEIHGFWSPPLLRVWEEPCLSLDQSLSDPERPHTSPHITSPRLRMVAAAVFQQLPAKP